MKKKWKGKEEEKMKLIKKPMRLSVWKRTITVSVPSLRINLSALNKFSKRISSNSDVIPVILDLTTAKCEEGELYNNCRESVSLIGILRGLMYLKYAYPKVYKEFLDIARYLSFELEEEKIPPLTFFNTSKYVANAFEILKKNYDIKLDDYIYATILSFIEKKSTCPFLKSVALFSSDYEMDKRKIEEMMVRKAENIPFDVLCEIDISDFDIETDFLDSAYEEEILSEIEQIFGKLNEELNTDE